MTAKEIEGGGQIMDKTTLRDILEDLCHSTMGNPPYRIAQAEAQILSLYVRRMVDYRIEDIIYPDGSKWRCLIYKDDTKEQCEWIEYQHIKPFLEATAKDLIVEKKE